MSILSVLTLGGLALTSISSPASADVLCQTGTIWCHETAYPCDAIEVPEGYRCFAQAHLPEDMKVIDEAANAVVTVGTAEPGAVVPKLRDAVDGKAVLPAIKAEACRTCLPPVIEAPVE